MSYSPGYWPRYLLGLIEKLERELREVKEKVEKGLVGAWITPTGFSAKLQEFETVQVRSEQEGTSFRFKGIFRAKEAVPAFTQLFLLPVGLRPPEELVVLLEDISGAIVKTIRIKVNGIVENENELTALHYYSLHGKTYHLK